MTFVTKRIVPAWGDPTCKLAAVAEAPGAREDALLEPLVGDSGNLFNKLSQTAGIARSEWYLNNVIKERPPNNNAGVFIRYLKKTGVRATPEYYEYEARLKEEMDACDANVIVAMGNISLYALTREWGITKRRGSIYKSTLLDYKNGLPRKVLACIHPAAALRARFTRQYFYRHYIINDLRRAKRQSVSPEFPFLDRSFIINPSFDQAAEYLQSILDKMVGSTVCVDIESMIERMPGKDKKITKSMSQIGFGKSMTDAISIPFWMDGENYWNPEQEIALMKLIAEIMEHREIRKLGQNLMYDTSVLHRIYGIKSHNLLDTMVMQRIAHPDLPASLEFLTSIYTHEPYYKDEREGHLVGHDPSKSIYNCKDVTVPFEIEIALRGELQHQNNLATSERQHKIMEPLLYMGEQGIRIDQEGMRLASKQALKEIEGLERELNHIPLNPRSYQQCMAYFYDYLGHPPYKDKGKTTINKLALQRLARKRKAGWEEAQLVLKVRELSKLRGTYYECRQLNGRFHFKGKPVGTVGGRISTAMDEFGYGSNAQNSPWRFTRYLIADDGYIFYELDKKQAENIIVAYHSPDSNMIKAFEQGVDIHRHTAALIFDIPYDEISDEPGTSGIGDWSQRKAGKTLNHALNYLMSADKFSLDYMIPKKDAEFLRTRYLQVYYGVPQGWNKVEDELRRTRILTNLWPFERRRLFLGKQDRDLLKEGCNWIPQSTVADLINEWGLSHVYYDKLKYPGVRLIRQVHDSITIAVPRSLPWVKHAEILSSIRDTLDQPLKSSNRQFIIKTECKVGYNLCKDSKPKEGEKRDMVEIDLYQPIPQMGREIAREHANLKVPEIWRERDGKTIIP